MAVKKKQSPADRQDRNPVRAFCESSAGTELRRAADSGACVSLPAVDTSAHPFLAAALSRLYPGHPVVLVAPALKEQESFQQDLETWLAADRVGTNPVRPFFYPGWEVLPHEARLPHADVISERLETLSALASDPARPRSPRRGGSGKKTTGKGTETRPGPIVVTSVAALMQRTFTPDTLRDRTRRLRRGDRIEPLDLIEWLEEQGYEPEAQVGRKGEIALRGGIVDVYPLASPWPVRLEFFGDELESLRYFDPNTQMSRDAETVEEAVLTPAGELGMLKAELEDGRSGPGEPWANLFDYLSANALVVLSQPAALNEQAEQYSGRLPDGDRFHMDWARTIQRAADRGMRIIAAGEPDPDADPASGARGGFTGGSGAGAGSRTGAETGVGESGLTVTSLDLFRVVHGRNVDPQISETQRREFFAQLQRWCRQGMSVHILCNNEGEKQRCREVWTEYGLPGSDGPEAAVDARAESVSGPNSPGASGFAGPRFEIGALGRGFLCDAAKVVVVTDAEIFGRYKVLRPRRMKSPHAAASRSALDIDFTEFEEGDYVVHLQHGIGRYHGLHVMPMGSGRRGGAVHRETELGQECLVLEFASRDPEQPPPRLYVPVGEAHLVSKYVGTGKARPPLNALGGARWSKAKAQAEEAVRDLAGELLAIQAVRESQEGVSFPVDVPWQREFESAFLFEETRDQESAIAATKLDMESTRPMDRLICGDVGFGKTEVAIRAAFKAVMGGKQVAMLVPTTVLAQQHYNTLRERMADYPVRLDLLSRFRTKHEQLRAIQDLASGAVDIVIGTHRLLQRDIVFKDLGLVIVDEEQRFGVMHKEQFKRMRTMVDVLTLSATPIPRTLYLALTGARDMSTIETPPQDRLPVETIVGPYDERVIRDAIRHELSRQGQVFFLHNRVTTIDTVAVKLRNLVPEARIVVGHGQMSSDGLEEVMTAFVNGDADVLLSTTIIESGLDIPNANTIIIDRADRFGLSELYQLRGRVGRYKHQAFAYLLLPRHAGLLTDARKRLSAIKQYSMLGSGFKIAMRDLEIRGAGNLLGPKQSGHITAVGFDLYCQLLKQSVSRLRGEPVKKRVEVTVRLDFLLHDPTQVDSRDDAPRSSSRAESAGRERKGKKRRRHAGETMRESASPGARSRIEVPRETATWVDPDRSADRSGTGLESAREVDVDVVPEPACIPLGYIADMRQRIVIYRRLAEIADDADLTGLHGELRDRFGPLPQPMERLLRVSELKLTASAHGVSAIESRGDKLMLSRRGDYIMVGGRFPRLSKRTADARLREVLRLVQSV